MKKSAIVKIDKREILDNAILLFLVLSTVLPAFISILYGFYDLWYWKAIALCSCASISLLLVAIKWIKYKEPPVDIKTYLPIAMLVLCILISSVSSKFGAKVLWGSNAFHEGALILISYYAVFISFKYYVTSSDKFRKIFYWIIFSGVFLYIYSWLQVIFKTHVDVIFDGGTFGHRNYMASYYTLLLLPVIALFFYAKSNKEKVIYYILSCMFFSTIIIVHTRSAWVANTIGIILFFILGRKKISLKKACILFVSFIIIVLIVNSYYNGLLFSRFDNMAKDAKLLTDISTSHNINDMAKVGNNRYPIWVLSLKTIPQYILFGAGPDMFINVFPHEEYSRVTGLQDLCYNAHNEYLNMILTIGIFALGAYIWLIIILINKFIITYKKFGIDNYSSFLALGIFCGWCSYLVQAFFNNSVVPTSPTLWAIMGIIATFPSILVKTNVEI